MGHELNKRKNKRLSVLDKMEYNLVYIPLDQCLKRNTRHNYSTTILISYKSGIRQKYLEIVLSFVSTIKQWTSLLPSIVSSKSLNLIKSNEPPPSSLACVYNNVAT